MQQAKELLEKYYAGQASEAEKALVESWYLQHQDDKHPLTEAELERIHKTGLRELKKSIAPKRVIAVWAKVAAAVVGFMLVIAVLFWTRSTKAIRQETAAVNTAIVPGTNKAILKLGDGRVLNITDIDNGEVADLSGLQIIKKADGQIVYVQQSHEDAQSSGTISEMHTLIVPRGGQYQIQLPDGTHVWLNSASTLRFPSAFNDIERRVDLVGEAYFEVAKRKMGETSLPFIVSTENQEVEVLGTHFNIFAYPNERHTRTTLLEGSVRINVRHTSYSQLLKPGQQAEVEAYQPINVKNVVLEDAIAWKNGYFVFEKARIETIMDNVARWYDVEVEYRGHITTQRFGGAIPRTTLLPDLLQYLETYGNIHFKIQNRKIIVMP